MILNKTTDEMINIEIRYADNFYRRFVGLLGKRNIDFAVLFCNLKSSAVHTHFMMFEIDVYFLDKNKRIYEKASLKPWKFHRPKKEAHYILECKKDELKINVGDKLEFI